MWVFFFVSVQNVINPRRAGAPKLPWLAEGGV